MSSISNKVDQEFTRWAIDLIEGRKSERYLRGIQEHFLNSPVSRSCVAPEYQDRLAEALKRKNP